jgi:hypothetical protein
VAHRWIDPDGPGRHTLALNLVHGHDRWFDAEIRVPIDVVDSR